MQAEEDTCPYCKKLRPVITSRPGDSELKRAEPANGLTLKDIVKKYSEEYGETIEENTIRKHLEALMRDKKVSMDVRRVSESFEKEVYYKAYDNVLEAARADRPYVTEELHIQVDRTNPRKVRISVSEKILNGKNQLRKTSRTIFSDEDETWESMNPHISLQKEGSDPMPITRDMLKFSGRPRAKENLRRHNFLITFARPINPNTRFMLRRVYDTIDKDPYYISKETAAQRLIFDLIKDNKTKTESLSYAVQDPDSWDVKPLTEEQKEVKPMEVKLPSLFDPKGETHGLRLDISHPEFRTDYGFDYDL